jgi:hypothetical protein
MTEILEKIEAYFTGQLSEDEHLAFEKQLLTDKNLADNVAFYLQTKQIAKEEAQTKRKAEFEAIRKAQKPQTPIRNLYVRYASIAASLVLLVGASWWFFSPKTDSQALASAYIQQNLMNISVTMGGDKDALQNGIGLFNEGKLSASQAIFEQLSNNTEAQKMAGIIALRTGNYDKAILNFRNIAKQKELYANPGVFLEAITLLKRNKENDAEQAKVLFRKVIEQQLEGAKEADRILEKLH